MKRSEARDLIVYLLDKNEECCGKYDIAEYILAELEEKGVIDSSQLGSTCSRCNHKGWESE